MANILLWTCLKSDKLMGVSLYWQPWDVERDKGG